MNLLGELQNNGIEFDIIFVQEARPSMIEYVSKNSDFKYNYYSEVSKDFIGNGVLSKKPFTLIEEKKVKIGFNELRSGFLIEINGAKILNIHLDHKNEDTRMEQLDEFQEFIDKCDILVGDLNSLNIIDFCDPVHFDEVQSDRKLTKWELVRFDVISRLSKLFYIPNVEDINKEFTCRFKTRIDYIMVKKSYLAEKKQHKINVENTMGKEYSGVKNYIKLY